MQIQKEIMINAPIDKVWQAVGPEFAESGKWGSILASSKPTKSSGPSGAPCSGRVCQTNNGMGGFTETLVHYNEMSKELAYTAKGDKMPDFVKGLRNHWKLKPVDAKRTKILTNLEMNVGFPFSIFPGPMMKMQMGKMLQMGLEELKYYVENGEPHPRKTQALQKAAA